ncbi:hypothetical protein BJ742DRAFT_742850 [Cladochytrium replicatum]|nr:hypothetical protein BJ742DRAFT_742850 [Cladochytrium replicatum]
MDQRRPDWLMSSAIVDTSIDFDDYAQLAIENEGFSMEESTLLAHKRVVSNIWNTLRYVPALWSSHLKMPACLPLQLVPRARFEPLSSKSLTVIQAHFFTNLATLSPKMLHSNCWQSMQLHHGDLEGIANVVCTSQSIHASDCTNFFEQLIREKHRQTPTSYDAHNRHNRFST